MSGLAAVLRPDHSAHRGSPSPLATQCRIRRGPHDSRTGLAVGRPGSHLSGTTFDADRSTGLWTHYTRHDYAHFNPFHTWVEFINRLLGAFAGLPALLLVGPERCIAGLPPPDWWRPTAGRTRCPAGPRLRRVARQEGGGWEPDPGFDHPAHAGGTRPSWACSCMTLRRGRCAGRPYARRPSRARWICRGRRRGTLAQLVFGTRGPRGGGPPRPRRGGARSDWLELLARTGGEATGRPSGPSWAVHRLWLWPGLRSRCSDHAAWEWAVIALLAGQFATGLAFGWLGMPAAAQPIHLVLAVGLVLTDGWLLGAQRRR